MGLLRDRAAAFTSTGDAQETSLYPWALQSGHSHPMRPRCSGSKNSQLIQHWVREPIVSLTTRSRAVIEAHERPKSSFGLAKRSMLGINPLNRGEQLLDAPSRPMPRPLASARGGQRCRRRRRGRSIVIRQGRATFACVEALLELVPGRSEAPCQLRNGCSSKEKRNKDDQHDHAVKSEYLTKHVNLLFPVSHGAGGPPCPSLLGRQVFGSRPIFRCRAQLRTRAMAPLSWSPGGTPDKTTKPLAETTLPVASKDHPADRSDPNGPLMRANLGTGDHRWILRSHV